MGQQFLKASCYMTFGRLHNYSYRYGTMTIRTTEVRSTITTGRHKRLINNKGQSPVAMTMTTNNHEVLA